MTDKTREVLERHFVEEMGLLIQEQGGTRMFGRVLGRLLICDPPNQSSADLADYLMASRGAISTTTRQLVQSGMIERVALPGDRSMYFRVDPGGFVTGMEAQLAGSQIMRDMAARQLAVMAGDPPEHRARLQEFHDFYAWLVERLPAMFEEWRQQRSSD